MRLLRINRYHNTEGEAGISQHFPLHIPNLCLRNITKHTDVKFGLPKIFTKSRWKTLLNLVFHAATFFQSDPLTDLLMLLRTLINSNPVLCICPSSFVFHSCAGELFVNVHYLNFGVVFTRVYHTVLMLYLVCKHTSCHCLNLKPFNSLTEHVCRASFSNLCISNHKKVMKMEITMVHIWEGNKKNIVQYQNGSKLRYVSNVEDQSNTRL